MSRTCCPSFLLSDFILLHTISNLTMFREIIFVFLVLPLVHSVCPKGSFINESGDCRECPLDTFNDEVDATSCKDCPRGFTDFFGATSVTDCQDCPPGMLITTDNICETCDVGTYNPFVNARKCLTCPKGTFSNTYNPSYCSPCRPGRVTNRRRTRLCKLCSGKRYQPGLGQKYCIPCPPGTIANPDGASCKPTCDPKKSRCKICPKGKELNEAGKCIACPEGMINAYPSVTKCQPCPDALMAPFLIPTVLVPNKARTRCVCKSGESLNLGEPFAPNELNPVCSKCPDGMPSNGVKCTKTM